MKKTGRKIIVFVLTVIMLCSALSVQSFAVLDFLKAPTITSVKLSENSFKSVSVKEMTAYYKEVDEVINELEKQFGDIDELIAEDKEFAEYFKELYNFDLGMSNLAYEFVITLSDGKTYTAAADELFVDINALYSVEFYAYVSRDEYLKAKNKGAKKVNVTVEGNIYSNLTEDYVKEGEYTKNLKINAVKSIVKSITAVSGVPNKDYDDSDYIDLQNAKFRIEYSDGTTKTAKVKQEIIMKDGMYFPEVKQTLDGNPVYAWSYGEKKNDVKLYVSYLDAECSKKITTEKTAVKSVKINKCDYDMEKGLQSITYTINWKNGEKDKFTKTFEGDKQVNFYGVVDCVDGYYVYLSPYSNEDDLSEETEIKLSIYVCVGEISSEPVEYEVPYADSIGLGIKIAEKLTEIVDFITNLIEIVFGFIVSPAVE